MRRASRWRGIYSADVVVVSCGAANGANMFHNSQAVLALSKEENPTVFQKTPGVNGFYFSGGKDYEFPLGNILERMGAGERRLERADVG